MKHICKLNNKFCTVYNSFFHKLYNPGKSAPGRFEGWSITAVATPKDLLNEVHSKGKASKPYFVNLTFWEDRPRLNLWEEIIQQRRKLEEEAAQKEAQIKV